LLLLQLFFGARPVARRLLEVGFGLVLFAGASLDQGIALAPALGIGLPRRGFIGIELGRLLDTVGKGRRRRLGFRAAHAAAQKCRRKQTGDRVGDGFHVGILLEAKSLAEPDLLNVARVTQTGRPAENSVRAG